VIGGIDADNAASIALHVAQGFEHAGTLRDAGYKFGRWLNLAFYQKLLPGPERPIERRTIPGGISGRFSGHAPRRS
jgi:phosphinothricin acetyltransferase